MPEKRAQEIIKLAQQEEFKAVNFRNLYQQVADLMLPRENQITNKKTPGEDKSLDIYDPTAMLDLQDMVSGLLSAFFPAGQNAFALTIDNRQIAELDHVKRFLALATQITHDKLYASNFMLQLYETLCSLVAFGTGCIFEEYVIEDGKPLELNFKDWDVSHFTIKQNNKGEVDTVILKFHWTARQAYQEFGDKAGEQVVKDANDIETESKLHQFIHYVTPRKKRNPQLQDVKNMSFSSEWVNVKEQTVVKESGYKDLCYQVPRWLKSGSEKYGRGQGTLALSIVKTLQVAWRDHIEFGNKCVNPPREILDSFEGNLRVTPGAMNLVSEIPSSRVLDFGVQNYQWSKDSLETQHQVIHRAFYSDVFAPLANLTGDRRTTTEIIQRVKAAMKKLAGPVYRLQTELFTPLIGRVVTLLLDNDVIPKQLMPPELAGQNIRIEYVGELALALRDQQAKAFTQFAGVVNELSQAFPEAKDTISMDRALPDVALTYGMKIEHLATPEEIIAIRKQRALQNQQIQAMQAAQVASKAYKDGTTAPDEGSASDKVMQGIGVK